MISTSRVTPRPAAPVFDYIEQRHRALNLGVSIFHIIQTEVTFTISFASLKWLPSLFNRQFVRKHLLSYSDCTRDS